MSIRRSWLLSALALSVYASAATAAQGPSGADPDMRNYSGAGRDIGASSRSHTPPPLPGSASSNPVAARGPDESSNSYPAVHTPQARKRVPSNTPASPSSAGPVSFDKALASDVNIDVVDMRFEEVIEKLVPNGWRVRFQHVDRAILDKRVDMTANASLKDVLYELLSQADLAVRPFDGFDHPLLLVTSSQ